MAAYIPYNTSTAILILHAFEYTRTRAGRPGCAPRAAHHGMVSSDWLPTVLGTGPVSSDLGRVSRTRVAIWGKRGPFPK